MINLREIMERRASSSSPGPSSSSYEQRQSPASLSSGKTGAQQQQSSPARLSIRDKLLVFEVEELRATLETVDTCWVHFPLASQLSCFHLFVTPSEGLYKGGRFCFRVNVPHEYNNVPPNVKCMTRLWHPNINEDGKVCLSLLRTVSLDGCGWTPTRRLKDVVLGLNSLFTDLLDFDDPLNAEAAEQWRANKSSFESKVQSYIEAYCQKQ